MELMRLVTYPGTHEGMVSRSRVRLFPPVHVGRDAAMFVGKRAQLERGPAEATNTAAALLDEFAGSHVMVPRDLAAPSVIVVGVRERTRIVGLAAAKFANLDGNADTAENNGEARKV